MSDVVNKLWGFCHTLRHDGIDYGDYIEQITFLLFLKMADEKGVDIPKGCDWKSLRDKSGSDLTDFYVDCSVSLPSNLVSSVTYMLTLSRVSPTRQPKEAHQPNRRDRVDQSRRRR